MEPTDGIWSNTSYIAGRHGIRLSSVGAGIEVFDVDCLEFLGVRWLLFSFSQGTHDATQHLDAGGSSGI